MKYDRNMKIQRYNNVLLPPMFIEDGAILKAAL